MAKANQSFEEFRRDLIAHLSVRSGLAPDVVAAHLRAWLRDHSDADPDRRRAHGSLRQARR